MSEQIIIRAAMDTPLADIEVGDRLRPVFEASVVALLHVIDAHGFTVPILLRKMRSGYRLIDGAHRLEAMRRRGAEHIPAMVVSCTAVEARALEATQNLAGASMSPLDDALFLAAYSAAYEELHPETRRGVAGAVAKHGLATELSSFADIIAEKRSISPRQVRKIVAAGRLINRDEANQLRSAARKVTLKDVEDIGKIGEPEERSMVVLRLASGNAKSAAAARKSLKVEAGTDATTLGESTKDAAFKALLKAWQRAPMSARKRFLFEATSEVWEAQNKGVPLNKWAEADDV
jgi:ParB family chromosome partitioning protein